MNPKMMAKAGRRMRAMMTDEDLSGGGDSDSAQAMGSIAVPSIDEPMEYSHRYGMLEGAVGGVALAPSSEMNVIDQVADDCLHPAEVLEMRKAREIRDLWPRGETPAVVTIADDCPVHASADIHKAQNLYNPMRPCTCGARPNAYG